MILVEIPFDNGKFHDYIREKVKQGNGLSSFIIKDLVTTAYLNKNWKTFKTIMRGHDLRVVRLYEQKPGSVTFCCMDKRIAGKICIY